MPHILNALANDELKVASRDYHHSEEYIKFSNELEELGDKIADKLDNEGKELLEKYIEKQLDKISLTRVEEFTYGYQIGSLIMMDIYSILKR